MRSNGIASYAEGGIVMASGTFGPVAGSLQRLFLDGTVTGLSEAQLLDRFLLRRDEGAFAALVERHGPMVLAVCRRVLRDEHAAEDAFQATFLLLVRRAHSIRGKDALGPWLHRVAYRVAVRASRADSRRKLKECPSTDAVDRAVSAKKPEPDLRMTIHELLDALPEKYRAPVVLCDLQGWTHDEAARSLRWPIGSVKGRLSRARDLLRTRLARHGLTATSATIAVAMSQDAIASIPPALIQTTIEAATAIAAGRVVAAGLVPASATALVEEAVRAMFWNKIKILAASMLAIGMLAGGAGVMARQQGTKEAAAETSKAVPPKTELEKLQGDWVRVSVTTDGKEVQKHIQERLTIRGDLLYSGDPSLRQIGPQKLEIPPEKSPSQIRSTQTIGPDKGKFLTMLYKLEGDQLTICGNLVDPAVPPADFGSTDSRVLFVYRRDIPPEPAASTKTDLEKMQGRWECVGREVGGTKFGVSAGDPLNHIIIRGDNLLLTRDDEVVGTPRVLHLNPSASPKWFEWTRQSSANELESTRGIYKVDDSTLILCYDVVNPKIAPADMVNAPETAESHIYRRVSRPLEPSAGEQAEFRKIQGTWRLDSMEAGGEIVTSPQQSGFDPETGWVFQRNTLSIWRRNGPGSGPWRIRLDVSQLPFVMERSEMMKTSPRSQRNRVRDRAVELQAPRWRPARDLPESEGQGESPGSPGRAGNPPGRRSQLVDLPPGRWRRGDEACSAYQAERRGCGRAGPGQRAGREGTLVGRKGG